MFFRTFRTLLVLTVAAISIGPAFSGNLNDEAGMMPTGGRLIKLMLETQLVRPTKLGNSLREVDVYLPAAYINDASGQVRFPVIYLLHGSPGKPGDFEKNGHWPEFLEMNIHNNGLGSALLVAPDGNFQAAEYGDSEWLNSASGLNRYEDFVVDEVVPYIDSHFRTIPTSRDRVICGVSEGGFGAVNIALHRPNVFSYVLACSGYYLNDGSGWARRIMGHDQAFLDYNSPIKYVDDPASLTKHLTDWQSQHYFIGSGIDEKRYTVESTEIADQLTSHKIPVTLFQAVGKHGWGLWNVLFIEGLKNLFPISRAPALDSTSPTQSSQ